jgi:hypothetical protein
VAKARPKCVFQFPWNPWPIYRIPEMRFILSPHDLPDQYTKIRLSRRFLLKQPKTRSVCIPSSIQTSSPRLVPQAKRAKHIQSPSIIVLPPLPPHIGDAVKAHNDEALRTFSQYIVSYARTQEATLPDACILPVSRIAYPSLKVGLSSIPGNSSQVPQVGGTAQ